MLHVLAKNWWALAIRGIIAVLFGIFTFIIPGMALIYLVLLWGAWALLDGAFNIAASFRGAAHHWALLIEGIIGVLAGVLTFLWPGITAIALLYVIAFWAIVTGVLEIAAGVRLRQAIANEWLFILMGVVSILFGVFILIAPGAGALAIVIWIGVYAFIFGVIMLLAAFRLRAHRHHATVSTTLPRAI